METRNVIFENDAFGINGEDRRIRIGFEKNYGAWYRDYKVDDNMLRVTVEDITRLKNYYASMGYTDKKLDEILEYHRKCISGKVDQDGYSYKGYANVEDKYIVVDETGKVIRASVAEFKQPMLQTITYVKDYSELLREMQKPMMEKYERTKVLANEERELNEQEIQNKRELSDEFENATGFSEYPLLTSDEIYHSAQKLFDEQNISSDGIVEVSFGRPKTTGISNEDIVSPRNDKDYISFYYGNMEQAKARLKPQIILYFKEHFLSSDEIESKKVDNKDIVLRENEGYINLTDFYVVDPDFINNGLYRLSDDGENYVNVSTFEKNGEGKIHLETHTFDQIIEAAKKQEIKMECNEIKQVDDKLFSMMEYGISELLTEGEKEQIFNAEAQVETETEVYRKLFQQFKSVYTDKQKGKNISMKTALTNAISESGIMENVQAADSAQIMTIRDDKYKGE